MEFLILGAKYGMLAATAAVVFLIGVAVFAPVISVVFLLVSKILGGSREADL